MAHWLLKTEPHDYSFDDLLNDGNTVWSGVNNNLALKYLRQIKKGDNLLIYHTGSEKAIVGIATASTDAYPDRTVDDPKQAVVDIKAGKKIPTPVTLDMVKSESRFKEWELTRLGRLSVMPVSVEHWKLVMAIAEKAQG